jgi:hypothetical protein
VPKGMVLIVDSTSQGKTIPSKDTFSIQFLSSFISKGNEEGFSQRQDSLFTFQGGNG